MAKVKIESPLAVGKSVLIRTVTYHYIGKVVALTAAEILLESAAWVADSGRWAAALRSGKLSEVEPYPDGVVSVMRAAVVDVCAWQHELPREVL